MARWRKKKGFPEPGKSTLPLSWQAVSQRAAVVANGTDSLQNLNDSISLGLHRKGSRSSQPEGVGTTSPFYSPSNHKGILLLHLDDNRAKGGKGPMSKHHKLWRWLCGDVMHVHGSVKFRYSQTKPAEDRRSVKRFRTFKERLPGKVILAKQYFGPCPQCAPSVIKYCTACLKMSVTSQ